MYLFYGYADRDLLSVRIIFLKNSGVILILKLWNAKRKKTVKVAVVRMPGVRAGGCVVIVWLII